MRGGLIIDAEEDCGYSTLRPKRKRVVTSDSDAQHSAAKATTGIHSKKANDDKCLLQDHADHNASSVHTSEETSCGQFKSRSELVRTFEPMIESFNSADYESLKTLVEKMFSDDVSVSYKMVPDAVTDIMSDEFFDVDSYVIPEPSVILEGTFHNLTGMSAVKLLWMFLCETHRCGKMEVIDRRICYRQVLPDYLQLFHTQRQQETTQTRSTRTSKEVLPVSPVSILEMAVKLSGACITSRALDVLFDDLSRTVSIPSPLSATRDTYADDTAAGCNTAERMQMDVDILAKLIPDFLAQQQRSQQHLSAHFSQEEKERNESSVSSQPIHRVVSASTASTDNTEDTESNPLKAVLKPPRTIHRKYLADIKLAFNEHDLITVFEFDLRAAEDFPE